MEVKRELVEAKKGLNLAIKEDQAGLVQECQHIAAYLAKLLKGHSDGNLPSEIFQTGYNFKTGFRRWFKIRLKKYEKKKRVIWRRGPRLNFKDRRSHEMICVWHFLRNEGEKTGDWEVLRNESEDDDVDVRAINRKSGRVLNFQVTKYDPNAEEEFAKFGLAMGGGEPETLVSMACRVINRKINKCHTPGLILLLDWYMVTRRRHAAVMEKRFEEMKFEKLSGIYIVCPRRNIVVKKLFKFI